MGCVTGVNFGADRGETALIDGGASRRAETKGGGYLNDLSDSTISAIAEVCVMEEGEIGIGVKIQEFSCKIRAQHARVQDHESSMPEPASSSYLSIFTLINVMQI
jgi:hypothetical protein